MNWDAKRGMNSEYRMEMHANEGQMNEDRDGGLWLCVGVDVDAATMRSDRGRAREADVRRTDRLRLSAPVSVRIGAYPSGEGGSMTGQMGTGCTRRGQCDRPLDRAEGLRMRRGWRDVKAVPVADVEESQAAGAGMPGEGTREKIGVERVGRRRP